MEDYLEKVRTSHPVFAREAMQVEIERARRDRSSGSKDWMIQSSPFFSYQEPIASSTFTPNRVYAVGMGATAERVFWSHGGRLSLSWESNLTDQDLPGIMIPTPTGVIDVPIGPSQFYENKLFVTYSYPLLQNRGGGLDRLEYELGDFNIKMSEVQAMENQEDFLLDMGVRFLDWVLLMEETRISEERLRFAEEQRDQTRKKRRANLVDEVDVLRAEDAVEIAEQNLVLNQSLLKSKQAELAVLSRDEGLYALVPEKDIYRPEVLPNLETAVAQLTDQRVLGALKIRRAQMVREKSGLNETTRPQLSLNVRGGLQDGDNDYVEAWVLDRPDVSVSLDFRYPLGNRAARADVERSELQIRQLEKDIETVSLDLEAEVRNIWIQITELEKILALNRGQIETARRKTAEEQRLYNQGRGELTFVIQSRDNEARAQLIYAVNAAAYQKLILGYRAIQDELLPAQ
jgi:outer membrane protein TolC